MSMLNLLKSQSGRLSLARVAAVATFVMWLGTWLYTLLLDKNYAHFETVTIATEINFFVVLMGKAVDSKILSVKENNNSQSIQKNI